MELFLEIDGERRGPFSLYKMGEMIALGEVNQSHLAWHRGLEEWTPAGQIPALESLFLRQQELAAQDEAAPDGGEIGKEHPDEVLQPPPPLARQMRPALPGLLPTQPRHPFRRFAARMFDYSLVWVVVLLLSDVSVPRPTEGEPAAVFSDQMTDLMKEMTESGLAWTQLFAMVAWTFLEGVLIHFFGTTPGKWLMGIRVRSNDGMNPQVTTSIGRAFYVFVMGAGFYQVPFILIGSIFSFFRLMSTGNCLWDSHLNLKIEFTPFGFGRVMLAFLIFFALLMLQSLKFS